MTDTDRTWGLRVVLYHRRGRSWTPSHEIGATNECHEGDSMAGYHPHSVRLTDWDGDGVQELSFLHTAGCTTDYSPAGATLVLIEGDALHRIEGSTWVGDTDDSCPLNPELHFADDPIHALRRRLR